MNLLLQVLDLISEVLDFTASIRQLSIVASCRIAIDSRCILEARRAAIGRVNTFQLQVTASLAGCLPIASDLTALALVASKLSTGRAQ